MIYKILDNHVVCLAGDGCLQEGVAQEAASFAGHYKLDNLVLIYDCNAVTLDAMADKTQSEDAAKKFEAMAWGVQTVDGHDMVAFLKAFEAAKAATGKPQLIIAKTLIGKGIPEVAGTAKAHGEGGAKFVDAARKALGLPEEHFHVSPETRAYFAERKAKLAKVHEEWETKFEVWAAAHPVRAKELDDALENVIAGGFVGADSRVCGGLEDRDAEGGERCAATSRGGGAVFDRWAARTCTARR